MRLIGGVIAGLLLVLLCAQSSGCAEPGVTGDDGAGGATDIVTDTSFMADIVSNVVGDRMSVSSLVPEAGDPHSFEPTPKDARRLAECRIVVIDVTGLVPTIDDLIDGVVGQDQLVIQAAAGLPDLDKDPHFWLDPVSVIQYVENIAAGASDTDPAGAGLYQSNAESYAAELRELDSWARDQVATIAPEDRLLVTDHESLGRFAQRYGFTVVGAIFPTTSGDGSPSARGMAELVGVIKETGAPAIFLETGANSDIAEQVAEATGAKVVDDLYTHSLGQGAPTYLDMMRWNVLKIVEALR